MYSGLNSLIGDGPLELNEVLSEIGSTKHISMKIRHGKKNNDKKDLIRKECSKIRQITTKIWVY